MSAAFARPLPPEGISFEIAELIMLRNWAENNALRLTLDLGHVEGSRQFEEYAGLLPPQGRHRIVTLWRSPTAVIVTPLGGPTSRFISMAHALAALHVRNGIIALRQNDIRAIEEPYWGNGKKT